VNPRTRRRIAGLHVILSVLIGFPLSWWLPTLDDVWFQRVLLLISFYAIAVPAADLWQTTDVRTQQETSP
jgi:hypothetical protein